MADGTTTITFDDADLDWARRLVEEDRYPSVEAAIRGALAETRERQETERKLMPAELKRRLETPESEFIRGHRGYFTDWFDEKYGTDGGSEGR